MATIRPFRGLLYNTKAVQLSEVVAPPYDVISPELQHKLYEKDPHNVVRLILNRDPDPYGSAAQAFEGWQRDETLVRDNRPAFYLLRQSFTGPRGKEFSRTGFIGLCRLEEFDKKIVLPHEKTLAKPKEDRLRLFRATDSNFSQVFALYADPQKMLGPLMERAESRVPDLDVTYDAVRSRLWRIQDESDTAAITTFFRDRQLLIADGHHRYETAIAYRNERRALDPAPEPEASYNYVTMFMTNSSDPGLVVLPTHRVIHSLRDFDADRLLEHLAKTFVIREIGSPGAMMSALEQGGSGTIGMVLRDRKPFYVMSMNEGASVEGPEPELVKRLDVAILHLAILRSGLAISKEAQEQKTNIDYTIDPEDAVEAVRKGYAQAAFFLNPTPVDQLYAVATAGHTMPQKSTFFYPKLLSGLVFHSHKA